MSRRGRHGRHPHPGSIRPSPAAGPAIDARPAPGPDQAPVDGASDTVVGGQPMAVDNRVTPPAEPRAAAKPPAPAPPTQDRGSPVRPDVATPPAAGAAPRPFASAEGPDGPRCTTAQLRRFIKSRPWVPMHELRRRFGIWGGDDDVSPMRVGDRVLFIGLPLVEAGMMAELLSGGDVGYELSLDPTSPIVVGVYPMRPVPRS
jgi:hypothetical protein